MAMQKTEIVLKKEGAPDITIKCPVSVKVPVWRTFLNFYPRTVTPFDKRGAAISGVLLGLILLFLLLMYSPETEDAGALIFVPLIAYIVFVRKYYINFIRKHIRLGYEPATEEQATVLKNAGIIPIPEGKPFAFSFKSNLKRIFSIAGAAAVVLIVLAIANTGDPVEKTLENLEKAVQKCERIVEQYESGSITEYEMSRKMENIMQELNSLDDFGVGFEDMSPEQMKRIKRMEKKFEELSMRAALRSYY